MKKLLRVYRQTQTGRCRTQRYDRVNDFHASRYRVRGGETEPFTETIDHDLALLGDMA